MLCSGGGWTSMDKESEKAVAFEQGVSFMSINYRYLPELKAAGIVAPPYRGADLRFLKVHIVASHD